MSGTSDEVIERVLQLAASWPDGAG